MSILEAIKQDHERFKEMFSQMDSGAKPEQLFQEMSGDLSAHETAEEKTLYPALEKHQEAKKIVLEALEEHHVARLISGELKRTTDSDRFEAKMKVLRESVEHHIQEEEDEVFKQARTNLSKQQLDEMSTKFETIKQEEMHKAPATRSVAGNGARQRSK